MAEQAVQDLSNLWAEGLDGFHRFLAEFPMLGLQHELGAAIADATARVPCTRLAQSTWYRGVAQGMRPQVEDFYPPDPRLIAVPEQRFNHQGHPAFYFAESPRAAALECRENDEPVIWVQRFCVPALDDITDLRSDGLAVAAATYCGDANDGRKRPPHLRPQYMVPRFVAECLRERGVRGILVPSVRQGTNLVLFRWDIADLEPQGPPEVVKLD